MTPARALPLVALVAAVVAVIVIAVPGGKTHDYRLVFQDAGQLVKGDEVQVGGNAVGSVKAIELTRDNQAQVTISMRKLAPLHEGTKATIRATSLSGVANRYISLSPGPNNAPKLDDGARITADKTHPIVDLDQLFNTLDAKTRRGLQQFIQGTATEYAGVEKRAGLAAHYFNPALSTTTRVVDELNRDTPTLAAFIVETSRVVNALASRSPELTSLVTNANRTTSALASESAALAQAISLLPPFMRRANTTFVNLRAALVDLNRLTDVSKPVVPKLAPYFSALRPVVNRSVSTFGDLRLAVQAPGANNDLVDLTRKLPKLGAQAKVVFPRSVATLRRGLPVLEFLRPYVPDLVGWLRDFGQGGGFYDANGHYARVLSIYNAFTYDPSTNRLTETTANNRLAPYASLPHGTGNLRRCPGSAIQPTPTSGTPFLDTGTFSNADCDPSEVLPGP